MKHLLLTTIAAVVLVGCGESQSPEPPTAKAPDISIHDAAESGNIEAVKQHLAAGADVNAKGKDGRTPLYYAVVFGRKEVVELFIDKGADVNAGDKRGSTPLDPGHRVQTNRNHGPPPQTRRQDWVLGWMLINLFTMLPELATSKLSNSTWLRVRM